jgi:transcriptional regulator with XRE-family HTH domain
MARLTDAIRRAVETSGKTRYRIAKESGVSAGQLSRLVNGERGMTVDTIERLADYLGLRITIEPKTTTTKTTKGR